VLLPSATGLSYFVFLGIFIISQEAGLLSQVPGGLGVFESALLLFMTPFLPAAAVLQALVLYRVMYYLLPLSIGVAVLGGQDIGFGLAQGVPGLLLGQASLAANRAPVFVRDLICQYLDFLAMRSPFAPLTV